MIKAREYAGALIGNASNEAFVEGLLNLIKRRGHTKLLPQVLSELEKLEQSSKSNVAEIIVSKESDLSVLKVGIDKEMSRLGVDIESVSTKVDESIVGGFIVKSKDELIDLSHKSMLVGLYKKLVN